MSKSYVTDELRKEFEKHELVKLDGCSGAFAAYRLSVPALGRIQSCLILDTPECIVICGDLCPNDNHGVCSNYGYHLEWFAKHLDEHYLCSKFMHKEYRPEHAMAYVQERLRELESGIEEGTYIKEQAQEKINTLKEALEEAGDCPCDSENFRSLEGFSALMDETEDWDAITDGVCDSYNPRDAEILCVIQQTFARLLPKVSQ